MNKASTTKKNGVITQGSKEEQQEIDKICAFIESKATHPKKPEVNSNNCNNSNPQPRREARGKWAIQFKCLYLNADSLPNKIEELHAVIELEKPMLISITEVKPKVNEYDITKEQIKIPGFSLIWNLDQNGRLVCIYLLDSPGVTYKESNINSSIGFSECVWLNLKPNKEDRILVGCIYRSPNSTNENNDKLNELMIAASNTDASHVLIMGDFNFPEINWEANMSQTTEHHRASKFLESTCDAFLYQHVTSPTRYREGQNPSTLDLIFTNEEGMVMDLWELGKLGNSDHVTLSFNFQCNTQVVDNVSQVKTFYDKGNYEAMRRDLDVDWEDILQNLDVQEGWKHLTERVEGAIGKHIPRKTLKMDQRRRPLWMNNKVLTKVRIKQKAWRKYINSKNGQDHRIYAKARNQVRWESRKAMKFFERNIAKEARDNPKSFWAYVNSKLKTRVGIADLERLDVSLAKTDLEKAKALNEAFAKVFTRENLHAIPAVELHVLKEVLGEIEFTPR